MRYDPTPGSQGLCPPGWHVPTSTEWDELLSFYIGPGQSGGPMKDTLLVNGFHSYQQGLLYLNNTWAFTTGLTSGAMYWTSTLSGSTTPSGLRAVARGSTVRKIIVTSYGLPEFSSYRAKNTISLFTHNQIYVFRVFVILRNSQFHHIITSSHHHIRSSAHFQIFKFFTIYLSLQFLILDPVRRIIAQPLFLVFFIIGKRSFKKVHL